MNSGKVFNLLCLCKGSCGACWAFVAAAAAEVAIKLSIYYPSVGDQKTQSEDLPLMANASGISSQSLEGAVTPIPPLSPQELVDCDVAFNRGCDGGNPFNAFEYILNNGLSSWSDYPYIEKVADMIYL